MALPHDSVTDSEPTAPLSEGVADSMSAEDLSKPLTSSSEILTTPGPIL